MVKKHTTAKALLFALVLAVTGVTHAQHCDSIINRQAGEYFLAPEYLMQLDDGSILCRAFIDSLVPDPFYGLPVKPYGCIYYKISRQGFLIMDSLFVEDNNIFPKLVAHLCPDTTGVPRQSNVLVEYLFDTANCKTDLRIAFFDDDLCFSDNEIVVPLADTIVQRNTSESSFLLDSNNDIVTEYSIWSRHESHFARFGLDGTLKHETVYHDSVVPFNHDVEWLARGLRQSGVSPARYSFFGQCDHKGFKCFELDSLLNIVEVFYLPPPDDLHMVYPRMFTPTGLCGMVSLGEEGRVVMREYAESMDEFSRIGVAKYDKDGNLLKTWFTGLSGTPTNIWGNYYVGVDLRRDRDGYIYFAAYSPYQIVLYDICFIAKLDKDLNVVYERYYRHPKLAFETYGMDVLDNGGMCVFGDMWDRYSSNPWLSGLFMLAFDNDGVAVSETEGIVRPYCFFPNPVNDQLNLHFSPDVTPTAVELYDLQGRLVHTQNVNLESINMADLSAGTYTLRVILEGGVDYTEKVIKTQ